MAIASNQHQVEQVRNEGNLKYMQGQLDSINKVLGTLSSNANSSQAAAIFRSLITGMPQVIGPGQTALEKMSNKQLRFGVLAFVRRLREMNAKYDQQGRQSAETMDGRFSENGEHGSGRAAAGIPTNDSKGNHAQQPVSI